MTDINGLMEKIGKINEGFEKFNKSANNVLGTISSVSSSFQNFVTPAMNFEQSIERVGIFASATETQFESLKQKALDLGKNTKYSSSQISDSMSILATANFNTNEILTSTMDVVKLATANNIELSESSNILASTIAGFNLKADDSNRVLDVLTTASSKTGTNIKDLTQAMSLTSASAETLNVSFEEVTAIGATLEHLGVDARTTGQAMNTFFSNLSAPPEETLKAFKELKIDPENLKSLGSATEMFDLVFDKVQNLQSGERLNVLNQLFGREHGDEAFKFMKVFDGEYTKLLTKVQNADKLDTATTLYEQLSDNLATSVDTMKNSMDNLKIQAVEPMLDPLKNQVDNLTEAINTFGKNADLSSVGESLATVVNHSEKILMLYGLFKVGGPIIKGISGVSEAMAGLTAVMMRNPLFLVAGGVAFAGYKIFENWDSILETMTGKIKNIEKLSTSDLEEKIKDQEKRIEDLKGRDTIKLLSRNDYDKEINEAKEQLKKLQDELAMRSNLSGKTVENSKGLNKNLNTIPEAGKSGDEIAKAFNESEIKRIEKEITNLNRIIENGFAKGDSLKKAKESLKDYENKLKELQKTNAELNKNLTSNNSDNAQKNIESKVDNCSKKVEKPKVKDKVENKPKSEDKPKDPCLKESLENAKKVKSEIEDGLKSIESINSDDELTHWADKHAYAIEKSILSEKEKYEEFEKLANLYQIKYAEILAKDAKTVKDSVNEQKDAYKSLNDDANASANDAKDNTEAVKDTINEQKDAYKSVQKDVESSVDKISNKIENVVTNIPNKLSNSFEDGLFKALNSGFKDTDDILENLFDGIGNSIEDLGDSIKETIFKDFSNAVTSTIFGTAPSEGNMFSSMFGFGGGSESYNFVGELLNAGYTAKSDGSYYNADTNDTIDKSVINTVLSGSNNMLLSSENIQYGVSRLGSTLYDYNLISAETNKSIAEFSVNLGEGTSNLSSTIGMIGGAYTGATMGYAVGEKLAPNSYGKYGIGALGAGLGAAAYIGGMPAMGFLMTTPVGWALAAVAAISTMFGSKYKAQEGFRFEDGMSINGKLDKEELAGIDAYTWYKQKTGSILGNSTSTFKYRPLDLEDTTYLSTMFSTYETFSSKLGGGSLSLNEDELKQSGRGRGLTASKLEEVLVKETLSNVIGIDKTIEEALTNGTKTIENPDLTEVYEYYKNYAKSSEKSITEVISETFGTLVQTDFKISQTTAELRGDTTSSFLLNQSTYDETITNISDTLSTFGIDIQSIDITNLDELQKAILKASPTPENITAFNNLANAVMEAEKASTNYVDSVANEVGIGAEATGEYWAKLNSGMMSQGEVVEDLMTKYGMSAINAATFAEQLENMSIKSIEGSVGIDNLLNSMNIDPSQKDILDEYIDKLAISGVKTGDLVKLQEQGLEELLNSGTITTERLEEIFSGIYITEENKTSDDFFIIEKVVKGMGDFFDIDKSSEELATFFNGLELEIGDKSADDLYTIETVVKKVGDFFDIDKSSGELVELFKNIKTEIEPITISVDKVNIKGETDSFAVGGYTPANNVDIDGKGGFYAILHPNEYILNAKQTRKHSNLVNLLEAERTGKVDLPSFGGGGYTSNSDNGQRIGNIKDKSQEAKVSNNYSGSSSTFSKKYDFSKELIDLGFVDEFQTSLEDIGFSINDFSLDNITQKMDDLAGTTAKTQEEYDKNSKAISYLTSAYLKAKETTQDILDIFKTDEEKLQDNTDVVTKLGFDKGFTFNDLDLSSFSNLEAKIESIDFSKFTPEELEEFKKNLTPIANSLKEEEKSRKEFVKSFENNKTSFMQSLENDKTFFGTYSLNTEDIKKDGADLGFDGIGELVKNRLDDIFNDNDDEINQKLKVFGKSLDDFDSIEDAKLYVESEVLAYGNILREGATAQEEFTKALKNQTLELQSSNTEFNQSLNRDSFYFGDFESNIDKSKNYGATIGVDGIKTIGNKWTDWLSTSSDKTIEDYVKSMTSDSTKYNDENGQFDIGKAKSYIASEVDEYKGYLREGLFAKEDFVKSYENFDDNFVSESQKINEALAYFNFDKSSANIEDFIGIVNGSVENINLEDTEKFKENSQIVTNWLNSTKSSLENFSTSIQDSILSFDNKSVFDVQFGKNPFGLKDTRSRKKYMFDLEDSSFDELNKISNGLKFDDNFVENATKVKDLIEQKYNYEKQQLEEQKSFILSIKGSYESLDSKYKAVNNINYTQSDLINQIAKLKNVGDDYLDGEISTFNTIYDSYIASLDKQIEVYDKTIESIEDLKAHIRDLRLGNLSYFTATQKSEITKTNYQESIGLLRGAISNGNTEDISKYLAEVKTNSQAYLNSLKESGQIKGYSLEFDKVVGEIGSLTRSFGNIEVKSSEDIQAEQSDYLSQVMGILSERQPLINESLQNIDRHFEEKELGLKETAISGLKTIEGVSQGYLSSIVTSSGNVESELVSGGSINSNIDSVASSLNSDNDNLKGTNEDISANTKNIDKNYESLRLGLFYLQIGNYNNTHNINFWLESIRLGLLDVRIGNYNNTYNITNWLSTLNSNLLQIVNNTAKNNQPYQINEIHVRQYEYYSSLYSSRAKNYSYDSSTRYFSEGGFTGFDKGVNEAVGVVHGKEYVAPYKQIKKYPELFDALEKDRKGFKKGGFTTPIPLPKGSNSSNDFKDVISELRDMKEELKRAKSELEEIKNYSSRGSFFIEKIFKSIRDFMTKSVA